MHHRQIRAIQTCTEVATRARNPHTQPAHHSHPRKSRSLGHLRFCIRVYIYSEGAPYTRESGLSEFSGTACCSWDEPKELPHAEKKEKYKKAIVGRVPRDRCFHAIVLENRLCTSGGLIQSRGWKIYRGFWISVQPFVYHESGSGKVRRVLNYNRPKVLGFEP